MTLSIGIGRGSNILRELDELAFSALSLCYSRGGDQVTVKSMMSRFVILVEIVKVLKNLV